MCRYPKEQQTNLGTDEEALRTDAETEYEADLKFYKDIDVYSSLDDRSINEPDEPGSAELTPPPLRGADASFYGASAFLFQLFKS